MDKKQVPTPPKTINPTKDYWPIIAAVIITALVVGIGVYKWQEHEMEDIQKQIEETQQVENINNNSSKQTRQEETSTNFVSIDDTWGLYKSPIHNFSIKVPKQVYFSNAGCIWDNKQQSYYVQGGFVPTKIFENNDIVDISGAHFYELTGEREEILFYYKIGDNQYPSKSYRWSGCEKVINSIYLIEKERYHYWRFIFKEINNDDELELFIKERYGDGCQIKEKVPSSQEGVFDIKIKGDGKEMGESQCFMSGAVLKYYPAQNSLVTWNLSPDYGFCTDLTCQKGYDQEAVDSFRFEY